MSSVIEHQEGKPNKKIYRITNQGIKELDTWLSSPMDIQQIKSEMMIKVFFGNQIDHQNLIDQIKERRRQEKEFLEKNENELKNIVDQYAKEFDAKDDVRFWMLTVDLGIRRAKMIVDWCDSALKILEE